MHTLIHFHPHRSNTALPTPAFLFPAWQLLLPGSVVATQSIGIFPGSGPSTEAGSQSGGVVEGRGVDACVREALSHIPPAAGSRPGLRRGVRLFLTTSQVPALIWELFISCQKTAFPCNCRRRGGAKGWGGDEGKERSLASK